MTVRNMPFGWPRIHFGQVPSTMPVLADLAARGARHGTVVSASHQSAGSGRAGRVWQSAPDASLLLSVLVETGRPVREIPVLSLLTAQVVAETVQSFGASEVTIKWPNDVLVRGRKISGVLLRSRAAETNRTHVVVGIGLNLSTGTVGDLPDATCLASETSRRISRLDVMDRLLGMLGQVVDSFEAGDVGGLLDATGRRLAWQGEMVNIDRGEVLVRGVIRGLRGDGALELVTPSGETIAVMAGELQRGPRRDR